MKILLVHSHYGSSAPSGENRVFELERDLLTNGGHQVESLERFSDDLISQGIRGTLIGAAMTPWNPSAASLVAQAVQRFKPDIVHAHNTFPMFSPSIFSAARGAARVLTLHNYRLVCPAAIPMRKGVPCTKCIDKRSVVPALRHRCYRNSRLATLPVAVNVAMNRWRGTWESDIEQFISLSDFQRGILVKGGIPIEKIAVKPNFIPAKLGFTPIEERPERVVFVGRLSEEKGVKDLLQAWLNWGVNAPNLRVIGDGPLRKELERTAESVPNISFLGQLAASETEHEISTARLLVMPSRCFETFGMVLLEAFRAGTPVAVSNIGPLPSLVSDAEGLVFRVDDPRSLLECVSNAWTAPNQLERMSAAGFENFNAKYTEDQNIRMLQNIYEKAIEFRR